MNVIGEGASCKIRSDEPRLFIKEKFISIPERKTYVQLVSNDFLYSVFSYLPFQQLVSKEFALISYQFYHVSKPFRKDFDFRLSFLYEKIIKTIVESAFYEEISLDDYYSRQYKRRHEQRFLIDLEPLYYGTAQDELNIEIESQLKMDGSETYVLLPKKVKIFLLCREEISLSWADQFFIQQSGSMECFLNSAEPESVGLKFLAGRCEKFINESRGFKFKGF